MAELGVPNLGRGLKTLGLILLLYIAFLPLWFKVAPMYAGGVAWTATHAAFPAAGIRGSVRSVPGQILSLVYYLPDARSGGLGKYRQRLLNYVDIPLALALGLGLLPIGRRRRLLVTLGSVAILFLSHVAVAAWSAGRIGAVLANASLTREEVERRLPDSVQAVRSYGDWSLLVTLAVVGGLVLLTRRRRGAAADAAEEQRSDPA